MKLENYNTITSKQFLDTIVSYLNNFLMEQTSGKVFARLIINEDTSTSDSSDGTYKINNYEKEYIFEIREKCNRVLLNSFTVKRGMIDLSLDDLESLYYKEESMNKRLFEMILTYMIFGRLSNEEYWTIQELSMMSIPDIIDKYKYNK